MSIHQDILDIFYRAESPSIESFASDITDKFIKIVEKLNVGKAEVILNDLKRGKRIRTLYDNKKEVTAAPISKQYDIIGNEMITVNMYPITKFTEEEKDAVCFLTDIINIIYSKSRYYDLMKESTITDTMTTAPNTLGVIKFGERLKLNNELKNYHCIFTNLKNFKYTNTRVGMAGGNQLLKQYYLEVNNLLEDGEIFGRAGGDNFIAIIKDNHLEKFINKMHNIKIQFRDNIFEIVSRMGLYDIQENDKMQDALEYASVANNFAKSSKINDIVFFSKEMQDKLMKEKEVLINFHPALQNEEFIIYYQPKINLLDRKLSGTEALVRWIKPEGMVSPGLFIPLLEKGSEICELDMYVLDHVCRDLRSWINDGVEPVRVSINISRNNLKNPNLSKDILNIISKYNIDHKYIELELTETSCYDDYMELLKFINDMHESKIKISIDDFGTGYSSINLLKELHADVVKIDKSLVDNIGSNNASDEIIIRNVVNMLNELKMEIVAEGVETIEQIVFLKNINCNTVQGYFFSKPIPKAEYQEKLYKNETW